MSKINVTGEHYVFFFVSFALSAFVFGPLYSGSKLYLAVSLITLLIGSFLARNKGVIFYCSYTIFLGFIIGYASYYLSAEIFTLISGEN